jgi:hypothetical protein
MTSWEIPGILWQLTTLQLLTQGPLSRDEGWKRHVLSNPVFIDTNEHKPRVKYRARFTFQACRSLISFLLSWGFTSQQVLTLWSAREITFRKWGMNFHLPKGEVFFSAITDFFFSGWPYVPSLTQRIRSPSHFYSCVPCDMLVVWPQNLGWIRHYCS